jgi:tetratricopeptide (TPR) repeat protein
MNVKPVKFVTPLAIGILLLCPIVGFSDQTDARLDELFITLQNSDDAVLLRETEATIWEIWFDSGREDIDTMMEEARSTVIAGELATAEAIYTQVVEKAPEFSEGWNRRATVRYYRKNYEGSLQDIHRTLILEPRHFGAIWGLGMILGWQRNFPAAISAFERLLEIKPNAHDARPRIELLKQELEKSAV